MKNTKITHTHTYSLLRSIFFRVFMNYAFIYDKQQNINSWIFLRNRAVMVCTPDIHYDSRID